jgi:anti-sigma factor RsiW
MPDLLRRPMKWVRGMMFKHVPMMITCWQFEDFILAYLADELPDRQRSVFELHLKICRECRDYLAAYRRTVEISKRAFEEPNQPVPDDVPDDLVKAILAARDA